VAGGESNAAVGAFSTIAGGAGNVVQGWFGAVPGGRGNWVVGDYSMAAGRRARTNHAGAFLWADNTDVDFVSAGANEFAVRASGGVRFVTQVDGTGVPLRTIEINPNGEIAFGSQVRQMLNLWGTTYGIGIQTSSMYHRIDSSLNTGGFYWYRGGVHDDAAGAPGTGGSMLMRLSRSGTLYTAGTINPPSDRALKTDFAPVDPQVVLARVVTLPVATWRYRDDHTSQRHLGPTAQDFQAAFRLGDGERTIATVDADGVALVAIQGLNAKLERELTEKAAQIEALSTAAARVHEVEQRAARLERELAAIKSQLGLR
jgi:hypothetical protein